FDSNSSVAFKIRSKGSIDHIFTVCIHTENQNQENLYPFDLLEISVLYEFLLGHFSF
ncbi:hypothetical protein LY90DRAFT_303174, partial [Neocallimastix californiae]